MTNTPARMPSRASLCVLWCRFWAASRCGEPKISQTRGPVILAPNHRAYMDPPYLSLVTKRQLRMMAKEELFKIPVFGPYIGRWARFRSSAARRTGRRSGRRWKNSRPVMCWAFSRKESAPIRGRCRRGKKASRLIARQTGAFPIIPIALEGTDRVHPMHAKRLHRAHVTATIGKPMTAQEMLAAYPDPTKDALTIISEATMRAIAALMSERRDDFRSPGKIPGKNASNPLTPAAVAVIIPFVARTKLKSKAPGISKPEKLPKKIFPKPLTKGIGF